MKHLLPILLILTFSSNLLIPLHSDWFYGSLASSESLPELLNSVNEFRHIPTPLDLVGVVMKKLFTAYGETGAAVFQIFIFFMITCLLYSNLDVSSADDTKRNSEISLRVLCIILVMGVIQYAQDLHPVHICIAFFLFFRRYLLKRQNIHKVVIYDLSINFLLLCSLLVDIRMVFLPILSLLIEPSRAKRNLKFIFFNYIFIALFISIFPYASKIFELKWMDFYYTLIASDIIEVFKSSIIFGITFDFGFLFLLISIYLFRNRKLTSNLLIFLILPFCFISYLTKCYLALFLIFNTFKSKPSEQDLFVRLIDATNMLKGNLAKLSYEGRVFILFAIIFVSIASFLKHPVTDELFPVKEVDVFAENGICPENFDPGIIGYLNFRLGHLDGCSKKMSEARDHFSNHEGDHLKLKYKYTIPDYWR